MSRIGQKAAAAAKYLFGTDAEVSNRDANQYQPEPTDFKQIGPSDGAGNGPNDVKPRSLGSPAFKFDDPL